jgi:hypothetical protein
MEKLFVIIPMLALPCASYGLGWTIPYVVTDKKFRMGNSITLEVPHFIERTTGYQTDQTKSFIIPTKRGKWGDSLSGPVGCSVT